MGDRDPDTMTGRVYRLAPPGVKASVPPLDLQTAAGCAKALQSPNLSTRYLAWTALKAMQGDADSELQKMWNDNPNPRMRSRALFLMAQRPDGATKSVALALKDENSDLRIAGLRIAEEQKLDVIPLVKSLIDDPSPQVRRECAIALRHNESPVAPELWAALARKHDGQDRWYLEALGIGADKQEEKFFDAWLASVDNNWNTAGGRDIVWRSRAPKAAALLAKIITDPNTPENQRAHYFRAFDFIKGPEKIAALDDLLTANSGAAAPAGHEDIVLETLTRLKGLDAEAHPEVKAALVASLTSSRGTPAFVDLVQDFHLQDQDSGLIEVAANHPREESGVKAIRLLLGSKDLTLLEKAIRETNSTLNLAEALGNARDKRMVPVLLPLVDDQHLDTAARRQVVRSLTESPEGAVELVHIAQSNRLPSDVRFAATMALAQVPWAQVKSYAAQTLPPPKGRNEKSLPPLRELLRMRGDASHGENVFARTDVQCVTCHRVNNKGSDVGPALSEIGAKLGKDALYEAILDPSAGIEVGFEAWDISLKSGDDVVGIVKSETDEEIIVKDAKAIAAHIKKSDIATRRQLKKSLMPDGLQQNMSTQDLVDLVEYLSSLKKAEATSHDGYSVSPRKFSEPPRQALKANDGDRAEPRLAARFALPVEIESPVPMNASEPDTSQVRRNAKTSSCALAATRYVTIMDWQQIAALSIVAATAGIFIWTKSRRRAFSFGNDTHCGCGSSAGSPTKGSIVFSARKGQRAKIIVKAN